MPGFLPGFLFAETFRCDDAKQKNGPAVSRPETLGD